jgi:hypothetical protein
MVKKMDIKRKIIAISIMVLFLAIPLNIAEANTVSKIQENEPFVLEIVTFDSDGYFNTEEITFFEEDFKKLDNAISTIMNLIVSTTDLNWNFLKDLIVKIFGEDNPLFGKILEIFSLLKLSRNRGFVISSGHGYDLNPLNKFTFKIRKKATFWHYNSNGVSSRTIIVKPLSLNMKILNERRFGFMSRFIGVYFFISRGFLKETYTFFMGTARHINGFQFSF